MNEWSTACLDWETRIVAKQSLITFKPLFPEQAEEALDVFGALRMMDATGSPLMSETVRPWVNDFVAAIFGAYDPDTGRRMISEFMLLISKKNGKSTIAAGIMLTALVLNWRQSGEFIILAPTKEIADNSYNPIRDMVKADEELSALLKVQDHLRTVTHLETGATLKVVAADSETVSGKKAIGVFIDELWVFGKRTNAEAMLREATGGLASRPEGFIIWATTQSDAPPAGVFRQKLLYARQVRDGTIIDKSFLPVLYEFPKHMLDAGAHREASNAYVTNPNLGLSVDEPFIERGYAQAQVDGEESFRGFLAKHLNVEIGLSLLSNRWAGTDFWEVQALVPGLTFEQLLDRCEVVDLGIDGGGLDDLLGFAAVGRDKVTRQWLLWTRAWAHPSVLDRRKAEAPRFRDFAQDGDLILVQRIGDDLDELAELAGQVEKRGLLDQVGVDPAGVGGIIDALMSAGVPQEKIIGISQGWKLGGAIKTAERKLAEGVLIHGGQPMMAWCCGNARVEPRGNAILITKQASGGGKIDPLMAAFNAISLMSLNPESKGGMDDYLNNGFFGLVG
ncbi:terminase large subunit [Pseudomonas syringae]|uniref:Terminase large subunit n=1 Tax=Pseudomonas syringae pv. papulans TaxID=83963 RepID=A0A0P9XUB5_PSESX|nr:terminase large subunit [Pseudomonas syringae]KPY29779.1 Phage terminase, large subunit [Pseudomonas syringae pv. papulans]KWS41950.1 terminase [Pseudomonas syringae pv. papulans]MDH4602838.1 terminase large subunit [Pseudomonas syringae pv. papulans]MDH4621451.1 terminase large subunit [Pseudomonas syringae pv. papulans]RMN43782.1 Phage terminase, large subunit [Pseudomonas syringae pv. papulans]